MQTSKLTALLLLIAAGLFAQTPKINSLKIVSELQGEQGVPQLVLQADTEAKTSVSYNFSVINGIATLKPTGNKAYISNIKTNSVSFKLVVTDDTGKTASKSVVYNTTSAIKKDLYRNKASWLEAVSDHYEKKPAFLFRERNEQLPNVLLIGNSISIGYTPFVVKALNNVCNIYRVPINAGSTITGLNKLDEWLGDENWDVIHFNFGLHDLKYLKDNQLNLKEGTQVLSPKAYGENLEQLVLQLKQKTKAKIIFANTTLIPKGAGGRKPGDDAIYNKVAEKIMTKYNIPIDDHYTLTKNNPKFQKKKNVHFKPAGSQKLGKQVAEHIKKALER